MSPIYIHLFQTECLQLIYGPWGPPFHRQLQTFSQSALLLTSTAKFIDHVLQPIANSYPDYLCNSTALVLAIEDTYVPDEAILVSIAACFHISPKMYRCVRDISCKKES